LAVKIVRQMNGIGVLGVPSSAASLAAGHERGPAGWRAAGLVDRLREAGFTVTDYGDCVERAFAPDEEHPRARNVGSVLKVLEELRPKVEIAVKTGVLPLVLGGDDSIVLGTIAGCRRYFRNVGLVYLDRDAGLNAPASTPSGCVDGMVISHVIGRGAPELVRFWGEPPLVREPDVALFGIERLDPPEQEFLARTPLRRYPADEISHKGASATAEEALERVHGLKHEFVLHVDLDVIASEDFAATNLSGPGGLRWGQLEEALAVFVRQPTLAALEISAYNPALDPDGAAAKRFIDLLAKLLALRLAPPAETAAPATEDAAAATVNAEASAPSTATPPAGSADGESGTASPESAPPDESPKSDTAAG
jgi:arginase